MSESEAIGGQPPQNVPALLQPGENAVAPTGDLPAAPAGEQPAVAPAAPASAPARAKRWRKALSSQWLGQLPVWVIFGAALGLITWAQAWFMRPSLWLNMDEGDAAAIAMRMIDGHWLPYVDGVSHRGPMLYWFAAVMLKVFGREWWVIRVMSLSLSLWIPAAGMWAAAKVGRPLVGAAGAVTWAFMTLVIWDPADGSAFNGELLLDGFAMGALLTMVYATRPETRRRHLFFAATGALVALATLSKQVAAVLVLPFLIWTFAAERSRPRQPDERRLWTLAYLVGGVVPTAIIVLRYVVAGELSTFIFYLFTYNAKVYLAPQEGMKTELFVNYLREHQLWFALGASLLFAVLGRALARGRGGLRGLLARLDEGGFAVTIALSAVLSGLASNASLRNYGHYFLQFVPWAGLFAGLLVERLGAVPRGLRSAVVNTLVLLPPAVAATYGWVRQQERFQHEREIGAGWERPETVPACAYIDSRSKPDQPIFIWGFRCQWYVSCHRSPASRYVFTTLPAGVVPWFPATPAQEEERSVPGSKDILLAELEQAKPPIVLDVAPSIMNRSMTSYPKLATYLKANYCPDGPVADAQAYVRKLADGSCPPPLKR